MFIEIKYRCHGVVNPFATILKLEDNDDDNKKVINKIEDAIITHQCGVAGVSEFKCIGTKIEYADGQQRKDIDKS